MPPRSEPGAPSDCLNSSIPMIVKETGLPHAYLQSIQRNPAIGEVRGAILRKHGEVREETFNSRPSASILASPSTVAELRNGSVMQLLGQAVLIRDWRRHTLMTTIAEAAFVQLNGIYELLECILVAIKYTLSKDQASVRQAFELNYTKDSFLKSFTYQSSQSGLPLQPSPEVPELKYTKDQLFRDRRKRPSDSGSQSEASTEHISVSSLFTVGLLNTEVYLEIPGSNADIKTVLLWVNAALSGQLAPKDQFSLSEFGMVSLDLLSEKPSSASGCWRRKIRAGTVLWDTRKSPLSGHYNRPFPAAADGLVLTAAALWSLFDNSLERIPGCLCTFRSEGGDHLVCRQKKKTGAYDDDGEVREERETWLLWHITSPGDPICDGQSCQTNIPVAISGTERGQMVFTITPCILDWNAEIRDSAGRPIAAELETSRDFTKRKIITRRVESYQLQGSLSAPFPLTPQILGGITFSKTRYQVANSIDQESEIALGLAAAAIVLVYCEKSAIHLLTSGSEIIDILCLDLLKQMGGCDIPSGLRTGNAETRLRGWATTNFQTTARLVIPGDKLVRQAARSVLDLLGGTKSICVSNGGAPVYWSLGSLLRFARAEALCPPKDHNHVSWHKLAAECPALVLAVGRVDPRLLNQATGSLTWKESAKKKAKPFSLFSSKPRPSGSLGAIVGSKRMMESWISRAASTSFRGSLEVTGDTVCAQHGAIAGEETFKVVKVTGHGTAIQEDLFLSCATCNPTPATQGNGSTQNGVADQSVQCLHYIQ